MTKQTSDGEAQTRRSAFHVCAKFEEAATNHVVVGLLAAALQADGRKLAADRHNLVANGCKRRRGQDFIEIH